MATERILPLDSLRGFAALGVTLFWHYGHFGPGRPFYGPVADWLHQYGLMLVDLFFVLSGFVLDHVYRERIATRRVRPFDFFVLRFSRLYPLHLLTLLVVAALQLFRHARGLDTFVYGPNDGFHFLLNLAFLQYGVVRTHYSFNGPSWSLTVEEISYLAFFVSLWFFASRFRLAFAALLGLGVAINLTGLATHVLNLDVSRGLVGFFSGALAHQLHRAAGRRGQAAWLAAGAWIVFAGLAAWYTTVGYPRGASILLVHSTAIFPALVLAVLNTPPIHRALGLRPLTYLGEISYSIYMVHFPVQLAIATTAALLGVALTPASPWFFATYAAITLLLASASLHLFERPAQAAIRRRGLGRRR